MAPQCCTGSGLKFVARSWRILWWRGTTQAATSNPTTASHRPRESLRWSQTRRSRYIMGTARILDTQADMERCPDVELRCPP